MSRYLDIAEQALRQATAGGEASACNVETYKKENAYIQHINRHNEAPRPTTSTPAPVSSLSYDKNDINDQSPPLPAAVCFDVPGVGDVWLTPSAGDAERLGIPRGCWLTPADLMLLEPLSQAERLEVLRWMRATGGILTAAPKPASRRPAAPARPQPERKASAGVALSDELRLQAEALGWSAEHLERLASLLRPGDRIGEVTPASIEIIRRSGVVQRYYHPTAPQPWRKKVGGND